jgi:hypothetical protein
LIPANHSSLPGGKSLGRPPDCVRQGLLQPIGTVSRHQPQQSRSRQSFECVRLATRSQRPDFDLRAPGAEI